MYLNKLTIIQLLLAFHIANCAVVLWGPEKIEIPALKSFDNDDFKLLLGKLNGPRVIAFSSTSLDAAKTLHKFVADKNTAYVPAAKIDIPQAQELINSDDLDSETIMQTLKRANNDPDTMVVLIIKNTHRVKRAPAELTTAAANVASNITTETASYATRSSGPVVYNASSRSYENIGAMIYSSKPPLLKDNGSVIELGEAAHASMDERGSFTRLIATIPVENGKIVLRFKFLMVSGYWYMTSVEVVKQGESTDQFNLTINQDVTAPLRFSYHCGGHVVFEDPKNNIELYLYDVQAQVDAYKRRFSDAYNCVPFTTGPIWSGIFVTFILAIGLVIGLTALGSIKTMDKFDNYKTKQLNITVSE